jgi:hypothetical protein
MAAALPTIIEAMTGAPWSAFFRNGSWQSWQVLLKAVFALAMTEDELAIYRACTGRTTPPNAPVRELWAIVGRRGGKSRIVALIAAFLAVFGEWYRYLAPGERATIMIIAADRKQARVVMRYLRSFIVDHPGIKKLVAGETQESITLKNRVTMEIGTGSLRSVRGYTIAAVICDEIAFWRSEESSANPADEILAALRPAMATMRGGLLMAISSPYARKGPLYQADQRHFGRDGDPIFVWKTDTRTMNPAIDAEFIDAEFERDPIVAASEYGRDGVISFRADIETFVSREVVDAAVVPGRHELPPASGVTYSAFVDPSGGSADSFTMAIVHRDQWTDRAVLDVVREVRPPFSPDSVVAEFAALLRSYGIGTVRGDRYAGEWPRERFRVHGIDYVPADKAKSDLYRDLLPALNSGGAELLDHPRLVAQLCSLERRTARGGRDTIDHPPGGHDDVANAVAGALVYAGASTSQFAFTSVDLIRRQPNGWVKRRF